MKIHFTSEGGMLGVSREYVAQLDELPQQAQTAIEKLIGNAAHYRGIPKLKEQARDFMLYTISIETDDAIQHFTFNDLSMPPEMEALISHCMKKAKVK